MKNLRIYLAIITVAVIVNDFMCFRNTYRQQTPEIVMPRKLLTHGTC